MRKQLSTLVIASIILWMCGTLGVQTASAHERRKIGGKYEVEVGWDREPTYANQPNAATIMVYKADGRTIVEGLEKTLKIKIAFGGSEPKDFPLKANWGKPGYYVADLIPTRAGSYLFTFTGVIEDTPINETFESGPGRFDDVAASDDLYFPPTGSTSTELKTLRDEIGTARTIGIGGGIIGAVGLLVGIAALATRRRS